MRASKTLKRVLKPYLSSRSFKADEIIDRRSLRKKISFWRVAAFLLIAGLIISLFYSTGLIKKFNKQSEAHIARVKIEGTITNDEPMLKLLKKIKDDENVKAVVLNISSPGGTTVGGEAIFEAVRAMAKEKPVATSVGTLAASAGYMIASATDHIVARRSSIVGSIGVLFQFPNFTELMDKIGVKYETVKSTPLKAEPSPFNVTTPEEREVINRVVQDSYQWFVELVADRRDMSKADVLKLASGAIYSGGQSLENGLIDAIGGEEKAIEWLVEKKGIDEALEVIEWKPVRATGNIFDNPAAFVWLAAKFGVKLDNADATRWQKYISQRLFLDGLQSVWVN